MFMDYERKIYPIDELAGILDGLKAQGKRVVHCHGNFDLLHIGHIRYLREAGTFGDVVVVTITPDRFVDKGPDRPAFNQELRLEALASLDCVDYVALNQWPTAVETMRALRPHVYCKGSEFEGIVNDPTGKMALEKAVADELGIEVRFTHDLVFSSTNLINRFMSALPEDIREYLRVFGSRYALDDVLETLERMAGLRVLVVGDAILDEYQYCTALGKSSKDPVLAVQHKSQDLFAGGVFAVANHLAGFADEVTMLTVLGEADSREDFVRSKLAPNVTPHFHYQPGAPTTLKRRFIDGYSTNKLLEIYVMDDAGLPAERDEALNRWLDKELEGYDAVLMADFGHGAVSRRTVDTVCGKAGFLAVNTQANAGNRGFNTVLKYPRVDYACMAEHELRLVMRNDKGPLRPLMEALRPQVRAATLMTTRGRYGCSVHTDRGAYLKVPSFALNVIDRIGAGDALFAVTSLAVANGEDDELVGFLGNAVGGLAVQILGNESFIDKMRLKKYVTALLK
jgi:cytidyltransferase-like protein